MPKLAHVRAQRAKEIVPAADQHHRHTRLGHLGRARVPRHKSALPVSGLLIPSHVLVHV